MNRKRHTTILALSAAAMATMLGLMAAGLPSPADPAASASAQAVALAPAPGAGLSPPEVAVAEDALAVIGALAATAVIRSVGAAFEQGADAMEAAATGVASESGAVDGSASDNAESRGHARAKRRAIAMPYFSFAQGLRGTRS